MDKTGGERLYDPTPCLINYLDRDTGWSKKEIDEKLSELISPDWRELHASDWGQILEDKGLIEFDDAKSRDCSRPEYVYFDESDRNEGVVEAIIRLIGYGPNHDKQTQELHQKFMKAMLEFKRLCVQVRRG